MKLRIRNWSKFQHYKHRNPPWIKLYRELLNDPDWHDLSGETAKGLMMLWLIAAEGDGELPDSRTLAFRLHISENRITALLSDCSKWLESDASNPLASCKQDATPEYRDREQRTEKREEKTNTAATQHLVPNATWLEFVEMRKKIRKPLTGKATELLLAKLERLKEQGNDPVEVLEQSIVNCWAGVFEIRKENGHGTAKPKSFDAIREESNETNLRRILEHSRAVASETQRGIPERIGDAFTVDVSRATKRPPN